MVRMPRIPATTRAVLGPTIRYMRVMTIKTNAVADDGGRDRPYFYRDTHLLLLPDIENKNDAGNLHIVRRRSASKGRT